MRTILDTPVLGTAFGAMARTILKLTGWHLEGQVPVTPKYVLIVAPHTSNWDFVVGLLFVMAFRIQVRWMGKHTLFRFPFGGLMRWLGGIPVNRSQPGQLVRRTVHAFSEHDHFAIALAPEGTRKHVAQWKTGFYWIAHQAKVPIVPAYIDFPRKTAGISPPFEPTGNVDVDLPKLQAVYANVHGKRAR
ncbi:lysophospholipid acyltransferase family protein [Chitinivorax sp. B]|uniref:lysophospholipid acyltransferase family protein n=1 Tax=Chitinivorax sp. B TaxID=2502235 RepID=UPI0010F8D2E5|nr:lysophospholipid acyltransferase family protein [Chitinivorax sp. B]